MMGPQTIASRPLVWPAVAEELRAAVLAAAGDAAIYLVGGVVRDAWLGRYSQDWDIATNGAARCLAQRVARQLGAAYYPLDDARDVGRVLWEEDAQRVIIDIAALRGERCADPIQRLTMDLQERDFTINAMAVDWREEEPQLIDPLGGAADLLKGQLRLCRSDSLRSDPLRAFRGVRLAAGFKLRLPGETAQAIRQAAPNLLQVAPERVREEWHKLLALPNAGAALRVAGRLGLLDALLPWLANWREEHEEHKENQRTGWDERLAVLAGLQALHSVIDAQRSADATATIATGMFAIQVGGIRARLQQVLAEETGGDVALRALAVLFSGLAAAEIRDWGKRWRYSGEEIQWLIQVTRDAHDLLPCLRAGTNWDLCAHRYWRASGPAGFERALLILAEALAAPPEAFDVDEWLELLDQQRKLMTTYFEEYDRVIAPKPLVDGTVLMNELGLSPGPRIGALLDALREAQVVGEIHDEGAALQLARSLAATYRPGEAPRR
ncbi:MAG: hypothetical protein OXG09_09705 [Chloroflexi bacterium]|nr:hypothetical protein [Chloroflexota bacterium]